MYPDETNPEDQDELDEETKFSLSEAQPIETESGEGEGVEVGDDSAGASDDEPEGLEETSVDLSSDEPEGLEENSVDLSSEEREGLEETSVDLRSEEPEALGTEAENVDLQQTVCLGDDEDEGLGFETKSMVPLDTESLNVGLRAGIDRDKNESSDFEATQVIDDDFDDDIDELGIEDLMEPTVTVDDDLDLSGEVPDQSDDEAQAKPAILRHGQEALDSPESPKSVYVILPEGEKGDAPAEDVGELTESIDTGEIAGIADAELSVGGLEATEAVDSSDLGLGDFEDEFGADVTVLVDDDDLDQLASDLDDDVLGDDEEFSESGDGELAGDEEYESEYEDEDGDYETGVAGAGASSGSGFAKAFLTLAAAVLLGGFGYYYYVDASLFGLLETGSALAESHRKQPVNDMEIVVDDPTTNVDGSSLGSVEAGRQAFRSQVVLAIQMGFMSDEQAK